MTDILPSSYAELLPEYYNLKALQADIHRRYLREQPVPAKVIAKPREDTARKELELKSEYIADRGRYYPGERIDGLDFHIKILKLRWMALVEL